MLVLSSYEFIPLSNLFLKHLSVQFNGHKYKHKVILYNSMDTSINIRLWLACDQNFLDFSKGGSDGHWLFIGGVIISSRVVSSICWSSFSVRIMSGPKFGR